MTLAFIGLGSRVQSAGAVTLTPGKPTVYGVGGLLVAILATKNNGAHATATPGWSMIGAQVNSGASFTASIWIAAEGAAAPVFTWSGSVAAASVMAYYASPNILGDTSVGATTNNNGASNPHSTSAISTTRNESLVIYADAAALNNALATPAGWTEDSESASATAAIRMVFGSKFVPASGSSSGAISVTGANAAWVQWQVELRVQLATGFQVSKEEMSAWVEPVPGFAASKLDFYAWIEPGTYPPPSSGRRRPLIIN